MTKDSDGQEHSYSKRVALDASLQLLRFQSTIHDAVRPNGLLSRETWFVSSLSIHDFLLAATIIYFTLIPAIKEAEGTTSLSNVLRRHRELISLLERSYIVWKETMEVMSEAKKAAGILELMVGKVDRAIATNKVLSTHSILGGNPVSQLSLIGKSFAFTSKSHRCP